MRLDFAVCFSDRSPMVENLDPVSVVHDISILSTGILSRSLEYLDSRCSPSQFCARWPSLDGHGVERPNLVIFRRRIG